MTARISPKELYDYQKRDIDAIFDRLKNNGPNFRLLYQLPTGGGKTVIFSEITRRFLEEFGGNVTILTHRNELCRQTSRTLTSVGVENRIVNSKSRVLKQRECPCLVAMVETLKNRIKNRKVHTHKVGLVIIDEAHHNSFRKLLSKFNDALIIGVTATPFSSDINLPMNKAYDELLTGESIQDLIGQNFLAKPRTFAYEVELQSLTRGIHGDFTVSSSDALYSSPALLELLKTTYEKHILNKKTLIFNAGIATSLKVLETFKAAGYPIRHLDNRTPAAERSEILKWFKKTKDAILTSVSILTTGFDEPTVQAVVLNRATTSLTLYHQMVGRGARKLASKKTFTILDLGNNSERFGDWSDPIDWQYVFAKPEEYAEQLHYGTIGHASATSSMSPELRAMFPNSLEVGFDVAAAFEETENTGQPRKSVIVNAIRQHAKMCLDNSESASEALKLADALVPEIKFRVKQYAKCLGKSTKNYRDWLEEDYLRRLDGIIRRMFEKAKAA